LRALAAPACTSSSPPLSHPRLPPSFPTRRSSDLAVRTEVSLPPFYLENNETARRAGVSPPPLRGVLDALHGLGFQASTTLFREKDRKSTRLNSSHGSISYAVFCLKKKNRKRICVV